MSTHHAASAVNQHAAILAPSMSCTFSSPAQFIWKQIQVCFIKRHCLYREGDLQFPAPGPPPSGKLNTFLILSSLSPHFPNADTPVQDVILSLAPSLALPFPETLPTPGHFSTLPWSLKMALLVTVDGWCCLAGPSPAEGHLIYVWLSAVIVASSLFGLFSGCPLHSSQVRPPVTPLALCNFKHSMFNIVEMKQGFGYLSINCLELHDSGLSLSLLCPHHHPAQGLAHSRLSVTGMNEWLPRSISGRLSWGQ